MSLKDKSMADLREIVRRDPLWRAKAWAEITYRNRFRQDMDRENGRHPVPRENALRSLMVDLGVKPWVPPDLSEPEPPREGPMV